MDIEGTSLGRVDDMNRIRQSKNLQSWDQCMFYNVIHRLPNVDKVNSGFVLGTVIDTDACSVWGNHSKRLESEPQLERSSHSPGISRYTIMTCDKKLFACSIYPNE